MELIKVSEKKGLNVVSARDLHKYLEVKAQFSDWIKRMIQYGFEENQDYTSILKNVKREKGGTTLKEYAITLDMAKEIAMIQRSEKGKQARQYFIECEKRLKHRQNAKLECKDMTNAIKERRELEGKETKAFHYSNEHNLIYKIVLGVTKKKYVETFELDPTSLRDQLPTQHIKAIEHMQRLNTSLYEIGMDYYQRKEQLNKVFNQKFAQLIVDEINKIEG